MIFDRTYRLQSPLSITALKDRLNLKKLTVHKLDFVISEKENVLKIIPHAEDSDNLRTLPITHINFSGNGSQGTKISLKSKPRRVDVGGPYLIVIFCLFCIVGAGLFYLINSKEYAFPSLAMVCVGLFIFIIFWIKMESGYFDYTRKIRNEVKALISA